jgi:hypothetical protein
MTAITAVNDHHCRCHTFDGQQRQRSSLTVTAMARADAVVSDLLNLEAARQGRSMLFSDEQQLLFKGDKMGFAKNTKLDFMRG